MFKRFQPSKGPDPFPIEEDITCPKCGFNHAGWAFEPGYAKLCVKCGSMLETSKTPERPDAHADEKTGFFGRIFHGKSGRKQGGRAQAEGAEARGRTAPHREGGEPACEGLTIPEASPTDPQKPGEENPAGEPNHETEKGREYPPPHDEPPDPEAARVGACKREGRLLAAQGRYEEAIEMFEKVVAFEPNDLESWEELGRIHCQGTGDFAKSIECSRKALEIDGDLVRVKCNLCLALLFDGQYDLARKGFLEVIRFVRNSRGHDEEFQENCRALLQDCLGELYVSKREASNEMLAHIREFIELLEIEKIYFH